MKVIDTYIVCEIVYGSKNTILFPANNNILRKVYKATDDDDNIRFFIDREGKLTEITVDKFNEYKKNIK